MTNIQDQFNATKSGDFVLAPGEYEGPLVIDRPCVFDGAGATLWANAGPVLQVASEKVQVKNLRIEVTGTEAAGEADVALKTTYAGTKLEALVGLQRSATSASMLRRPLRLCVA